MTRAEILEKAKACVTGQRIEDYGKPENSFGNIAELWSVYLDANITPHDVAVMMALLKIARIMGGGSADCYIDLAGYAACAAELSPRVKTEENENPAAYRQYVKDAFEKQLEREQAWLDARKEKNEE